jgi:hypothetical protein
MRRLLGALLAILATTAIATATGAPPAAAGFSYQPVCNLGQGESLGTEHGVQAWILHSITHGTTFYQGEFCAVGKSFLTMQTDGNFVLYDENSHPRWATNTVDKGSYTDFQVDGNLVVYEGFNTPVWASNTCCRSFAVLAVQADGNVVIYDRNDVPVWATNTPH